MCVWQPRWLSVLSCGSVCRSCVTVIARLASTQGHLYLYLYVPVPVGGYHHPPHAHTSCENGGEGRGRARIGSRFFP